MRPTLRRAARGKVFKDQPGLLQRPVPRVRQRLPSGRREADASEIQGRQRGTAGKNHFWRQVSVIILC